MSMPAPESADRPAWPALIGRARQGEIAAWEQLFALARPWAYARLMGRVHDHHSREDLVQEIMLTLCRRLDALREPERFPGWFCALVDNAAHAWGRRRHAQLRLEDALRAEPPMTEAGTGYDSAPDPERHGRLAAAFQALSREHQAVVRSRYLAGHSYAEAASLLDLPEDRVRGRLQKARLQLKHFFETMNLTPESYPLSLADIATLSAVSAFTLHTSAKPVLAGICLGPRGHLVCTDGRRIVFRHLQSLAGLTRSVVLGPCRPHTFSELGAGLLRPELSCFRLEEASGRLHELPMFTDAEYPSVDHLRSTVYAVSMRFRAGALRLAVAGLSPMLEERHPARDGLSYSPVVRLRMLPAERTLLLETDQKLGYATATPETSLEDTDIYNNTPGWRHVLELMTDEVIGAWPERERLCGINAHYINQALDALELTGSDEVWLRWQTNPETGAVCIEAAGATAEAERRALVMPIRLTA